MVMSEEVLQSFLFVSLLISSVSLGIGRRHGFSFLCGGVSPCLRVAYTLGRSKIKLTVGEDVRFDSLWTYRRLDLRCSRCSF